MRQKITLLMGVAVLAFVAGMATCTVAQTYEKTHASSLILAGGGTDAVNTLSISVAALSGASTLTLPGGNAAGVLTNNGSGTLSWTAITYSILTSEAASTLLGNPTGSPANTSTITLGSGLAFSGTTLVNSGILSVSGTANQITASTTSGATALSLPTTVNLGSSSAAGTIQLTDGTNDGFYGILKPTTLTGSNQTYTLPNATGTIALTSSNITGTAAGLSGSNLTGDVTNSGNATTISSTGTAGTTAGTHIVSAIDNSSSTGQIDVANGGTGAATLASNGVLYGNGTGAVQVTAASSAAGQFLQTTSLGGVPSWRLLASGDIPNNAANTTGTANIAGGTAGAIPYQSAANTTSVLAATSTAKQLLMSGASAAPIWSTSTYPATDVAGGLRYISATNTVSDLAIGTTGQVLTVSGGLPVWSSPTTNGTVTSVNVAIGGMTSSGAITTSGTITMSGQLAIANGGTNSAATPTNGGIGYGTGTAHAYSAAGTSGQVLISGGTGTPTWTTNIAGSAGNVTGTVGVGNGGTGLTAGISGGIPYYSSTSAMTSSALLAANGVVIGGGAGTAPSTIATANNGVLITSSGGVPSISSTLPSGITLVAPVLGTPASGTLTNATGLPLTTGVTGILPLANGGTGQSNASGVAQNSVFAGPSSGGAGAASFRTLTAADLAVASHAGGSIAILGRATTTLTTSSTTLIDATGYSLTMAANEIWAFEFDVDINGAGNGIHFAVTVPTGATVEASCMGIYSSITNFTCDRITTSGTATAGQYGKTNSDGPVRITGVVVNGSTAGNIQLQYESEGGTVTIFANSYGIAHRF